MNDLFFIKKFECFFFNSDNQKMNKQDLRFYQFPAGTSDEEKIIFAKTHNYSVREISGSFGFGNTKIGRVWKQYQEKKFNSH